MKFIMIIGFLVGLLGVGLVSYGAWLYAPPAGYVICGLLCLCFSWMVSRSVAVRSEPRSQQGDS